MKSEPGGTGAGDRGGGFALPLQSPRLPRLFSSFPPSESLEQTRLSPDLYRYGGERWPTEVTSNPYFRAVQVCE